MKPMGQAGDQGLGARRLRSDLTLSSVPGELKDEEEPRLVVGKGFWQVLTAMREAVQALEAPKVYVRHRLER